MRIASHLFEILYKETWTLFRDRFVIKPVSYNTYSQQLWTHRDEKGILAIHDAILKGVSNNEKYLYKMWYKSKSKKEIEVDDLIIVNVLEFLGFSVQENMKNKNCIAKKLPVLMQQFMNKYFSEESVANRTAHDILHDHYIPSRISDEQELGKAICILIKSFYAELTCKNFSNAWEMLTEDFQNRLPWKGNYGEFEKGYVNSGSKKNVHVFDINHIQPSIVEAKVFYEDEIALPHSHLTEAIRAMTLGNIDDYVSMTRNLGDMINNNGGKNFENIELYKTFEPNAPEYIWYKCGINPQDIEKIFPFRKTIVVNRLYKFTCKCEKGCWKIFSIRGIPVQSER